LRLVPMPVTKQFGVTLAQQIIKFLSHGALSVSKMVILIVTGLTTGYDARHAGTLAAVAGSQRCSTASIA
jgi:hypothetical protein